MPRLTHLAGLELSTEREPQHRRARARRRAAARASVVGRPDGRAAQPRRLGCPAAMPPEERVVPRFAAEPPQEELPYGRWEERLSQEFLAAAGRPRRGGRGSRRAGRGRLVSGPQLARAHVRARPVAPRAAATSCSATCASSLAGEDGEPGDFFAQRRLHAGDRRAQPRLAAGPVRRGDRRLARAARRRGRDDARVGAPARLRRARSSRPSSPTWPSTSASWSTSASR